MPKVFIAPSPQQSHDGIARVSEALWRYLPDNGFQIVENMDEADVINIHGLSIPPVLPTNKPVVYTSHGLYWADVSGWPHVFEQFNQEMIDAMRQADHIVAVSEWVAQSIRRGLSRPVSVVHHGIDIDEWRVPHSPTGYVFWGKGRPDPVCNPDEMNQLAALLPGQPFVSTFGKEAPNVRIVGYLERDSYKRFVAYAGVYLSLARETFGVGTLEALACGVPVVGWKHGGNVEIVKHGLTGYLADYGNYEQLAEYVTLAIESRAELSRNAREDAETNWNWPRKIAQVADVYRDALDKFHQERPLVSVVVTAHNLEKYLPETIESVMSQEGVDWECLIIDDCSTDNTPEIARHHAASDPRVRYIKTPVNVGLSEARNVGFAASRGKYIIPLDADDVMAHPHVLRQLSQALEQDRSIHVAYGHLDIIGEDGEGRRRNDWPVPFNWYGQMAHLNQLPYFSMMRREVWENTGGYRIRHWRAEDASFWCNVTAHGYRPAKVTEQAVLLYRIRGDSKSAMERQKGYDDGDWTRGFPWRVPQKGNAQDGFRALEEGARPPAHVVPFGAVGERPGGISWPVHPHANPIVTVIIPVGPTHAPYVIDAVDSVISQTFPFYDIIVINDSGEKIRWLPEWVTVFDTGGLGSIGHARNLGLINAKSPLVVFLDADDMLLPTALEEMLTAYQETSGTQYIYTDWFNVSPEGIEAKSSLPYVQKDLKGKHPISILADREIMLELGGFDENIRGWEDWDMFIKCAISGYCGYHLQSKLLAYRIFSGNRREESLQKAEEVLAVLNERYDAYATGGKPMSECGGCGDGGSVVVEVKRMLGLMAQADQGFTTSSDGMVRLEFIGKRTGGIMFRQPGLTKGYRGGNNPTEKYVDAPEADARILEQTNFWRRINRAPTIDLTQAQFKPVQVSPEEVVSQVMNQPAPSSFAPPEEDDEVLIPALPPVPEEFDPNNLTLPDLTRALIGKDEFSLQLILQQELSGKARKGAISLIEDAIEVTRRVG